MAAPDLTHWQGEPVRVWENVLGVPVFEAWARLGSTNDRARELAAAGAPAWTVVVAEEQIAGRGRGGQGWSSPARLGLWVSLVLRPRLREHRSLLPLLIGLCVALELERLGVEAAVKWPNDVLVKGRKVAGVLCEGAEPGVVAGIGLNLAQRPEDFPEALRGVATSVRIETGRDPDAGRVLVGLVRRLRQAVDTPQPTLDDRWSAAFHARDALNGRRIRVQGVEGIARGVDHRGRLRLEVEPGTLVPVVAGHVERIDGGGPAAAGH